MTVRATADLYRRRGSDVTEDDVAQAEALEAAWRGVAHRSGVTDADLAGVINLADAALGVILMARRRRAREHRHTLDKALRR